MSKQTRLSVIRINIQTKQQNIDNDNKKTETQSSSNNEAVQIEIDEDSYDEAESVNEDNLNSLIINSSDRVCTKMYVPLKI